MAQDRMARLEKRRQELHSMSDDELKRRFWELCDKAVQPMVDLSRTHTSPSVERSVLMRMGIDSFTAQAVVAKVTDAGLLAKGAGHAVVKVARRDSVDMRAAAKTIAENPEVLKGLFG
jgi:D-ornithine 4,5-aminomutase subunit alpha